ncbi:MAG: alpha/beta hydrolase [Geodermatophilaceae bacterium]
MTLLRTRRHSRPGIVRGQDDRLHSGRRDRCLLSVAWPEWTSLVSWARCENVATLILCGDDDRTTPKAHSELLAEKLPGSELVIVADAGHLALMERPDAVNEHLKDFLPALLRRSRVHRVPSAGTVRGRRQPDQPLVCQPDATAADALHASSVGIDWHRCSNRAT